MSQTRNYLSLDEKRKILNSLSEGESVTSLSKKFGVAKSTICGIKKKKQRILNMVDSTFGGTGKRKTLKISTYPKMEAALYEWFLQMKEQNKPVSGLMMQKKAKTLQKLIDKKTLFSASNGWFNRFKKRFGIPLAQTGEKLSSEPFPKDTAEELDLTPDQIYIADESDLYWEFLPDESYVLHPEDNAENARERITFLTCTNTTGNHKLKPLVMEKPEKPPDFQNFDYRNSKTAWMTMSIFKEWFQQKFVPQVTTFLMDRNLPIRALLLLDKAASDLPETKLMSHDGLISVMYMPLPPNGTTFVQPMDQNANRITKLFYRENLLTRLLPIDDEAYTLRDAVCNLSMAWNSFEPVVIEKHWCNLLDINSDDNIPSSDETHNVHEGVANLLKQLNPNVVCERIDVNEWNEDIKPDNTEQLIETDSESETTNEDDIYPVEDTLISPNQALTSLNQVIQWVEENENEVQDSSLFVLHDLRQKILQKLS